MNEIKCPHCGKTITISDSDYAEIQNQVRDEILAKQLESEKRAMEAELEAKLAELKAESERQKQRELDAEKEKRMRAEKELAELKGTQKSELDAAIAKKEAEIVRLESEIKAAEAAKKLAVKEAIDEQEKALANLKQEKVRLEAEIGNQQVKHDLELSQLKQQQSLVEKQLEDEVAYYKNLKAQTNVKLLGETLEQHCLNSFRQCQAQIYPHATFGKDNDVVEGTKGDFVFRDFDDEGNEIISIMFEMKNEADDSVTKHKNEDFFKKLDEDRKKKGCEYAVLCTLLEKDNELYNAGIVDLSYAYPKMFAIRPQFFLPIIALLDQAARKNAANLIALEQEKKRNVDIANFETELEAFKHSIGTNYERASKNFAEAIAAIDKSMAQLQKVRDSLVNVDNNLRIANNKAQDLSIRRLTKNSPSLRAEFEAIETDATEE